MKSQLQEYADKLRVATEQKEKAEADVVRTRSDLIAATEAFDQATAARGTAQEQLYILKKSMRGLLE